MGLRRPITSVPSSTTRNSTELPQEKLSVLQTAKSRVLERPVSNHIGLLVFDFYRKTEEKSMAEILEKVLVEVVKAVGKGAAKIIVWTAHQIEKK